MDRGPHTPPMQTPGEAGRAWESLSPRGARYLGDGKQGEHGREVRHLSCSLLCRALPRGSSHHEEAVSWGERRSFPNGF
jgi:hypothetical protein